MSPERDASHLNGHMDERKRPRRGRELPAPVVSRGSDASSRKQTTSGIAQTRPPSGTRRGARRSCRPRRSPQSVERRRGLREQRSVRGEGERRAAEREAAEEQRLLRPEPREVSRELRDGQHRERRNRCKAGVDDRLLRPTRAWEHQSGRQRHPKQHEQPENVPDVRSNEAVRCVKACAAAHSSARSSSA